MPGGANKMARLESPAEANRAASNISTGLRVTATLLRTTFIFLLLALTLRVAMPQSETVWSSYETPRDLVRLLLGLGVCAWLVVELFRGPKDAQGYRTWLYLGLAAVPFALICLIAIW
jgi:hypothetical protein